MVLMPLRSRAVALLVLLLAGCATLQHGDGAPPGSATIHDTVKEVPSVLVPLVLGVAGIGVSVEGTAVATHLGSDGSFTLQGVPSGDITLVFAMRGGEVRMQLGGIMPQQTIRVSVVQSELGATIDAISRSIDDLVLSIVPDVWELGWAQETGELGGATPAAADDVVSAFVHGDSALLSALDDAGFDFAGDDPDAEPLVPATVIRAGDAIELRFGRADVLALLLEPALGREHEVRLGVCFVAPDDDTGATTVPLLAAEAQTYELVGQISIASADEPLEPAPALPSLSATLDPCELPLEPDAQGEDDVTRLDAQGEDDITTVRLVITGAAGDLASVSRTHITLGFDDAAGDAEDMQVVELGPDVIAMSVAIDEDGTGTTGPLLRERAQRQGNHVRAYFYQRDVIALIDDPVPGTSYEILLHLGDETLPATIRATGPPH